ncbi:MAG: hypothetical protein QME64_06045 [bacterium]|nr:hypothetical protein [bacterium]
MVNRLINYSIIIGFWFVIFSQSLNTQVKPAITPQIKPEKPKLYFQIPPPPAVQPDEFSAILIASQITAQFRLPNAGYAGDVFPVQYYLSGIGLAAVEATAFENPEYLTRWVYTTSAFPRELRLLFNYLGTIPTNKAGEYPKELRLKLSNRFSVNRYYRLFYELRNFGKTMLKSRGYGNVSYRLQIVTANEASTEQYSLDNFSPKADFDLYPGEKQVVSYLIKPLAPGSYIFKLVAFLNDTQPVAETDLPVTVVNAEFIPIYRDLPDPGAVIPESIPVPAPAMFPVSIKEWQEPLHSFRIHELKEPELTAISGVLWLPMPDRNCSVVLRVVTPSGLATATVKVSLKQKTNR